MDSTQTITHLGLCAGYGGIELGFKRVLPTLRTVAFCEIEAFACANLVAKMEQGFLDPAPIWTDLKSFPWEEFCGKVDILTGGYPCQPFSAAGKRLGTDDPRHLWPFIANGIRLLQPGVCFFENVEGHITLGLRQVVEELEELGYKTTWGIFSAAEVGAPHQRKRVFILAYRNDARLERHWRYVAEHGAQGRQKPFGYSWPSHPSEPQHEWEPPRVVGNAAQREDHGRKSRDMGEEANARQCGDHAADNTSESMGNPAHAMLDGSRPSISKTREPEHPDSSGRQIKPTLGRDIDANSDWMDDAQLQISYDNRTDELRLLGNGVVPATAEKAFCILARQLFEDSLL